MPEPTPDLHTADTCFYEERRIRPAFPHIHGAHLAECAPALSAGRAGGGSSGGRSAPGPSERDSARMPRTGGDLPGNPAVMGGRTGPRAILGSAAGRVNGRAALGVVEVGARQRAAQRPESGRDGRHGQDHLVRPPHTGSARQAEQGPRGEAGTGSLGRGRGGRSQTRGGSDRARGAPEPAAFGRPQCVNAPRSPRGSPSSTRGTDGARRRDAHRHGQRRPRPPGESPMRAAHRTPHRHGRADPARRTGPRTRHGQHGPPHVHQPPAPRNGPRRRRDTRVSAPAGGTRYGSGRPGPRRPPSRRLAPTRSRSAE